MGTDLPSLEKRVPPAAAGVLIPQAVAVSPAMWINEMTNITI